MKIQKSLLAGRLELYKSITPAQVEVSQYWSKRVRAMALAVCMIQAVVTSGAEAR